MVNPMGLFQLKSLWDKFRENHPKFPMFLSALQKNGIKEGTIIEITITEPDGEKIQSNIKISASDLELFEQLKNISSSMQ
ncbi:MAG: hypothetical protein IJV29_05060 [Butyrivibrio sp.]|jgi:hypothetical protein|nr:hypothetical protein [Butyrivibrio sp.]MCR4832386.1 hypothetical protein [Butyrivibrio sp.]